MGTLVYLVMATLLALAIGSIVLVVRSFMQTLRGPAGTPYVAVEVLFPSAPIADTPGGRLVGVLAIAWAAGQWALAVAWWVTGLVAPLHATSLVVAIYALVAALMTGVGGGLFLARQSFGRKLIAYGQMLVSVPAFFASAVALTVPYMPEAPASVQAIAHPLAAGLAGYLAAALILGYLGQHVAKPKPR